MAEQNPTTFKPCDGRILCIPDLEKAASEKLELSARDYYNSGSTDQTTLRANSLAFQKYRLRPRVLRPVSAVSTSTVCFGREIAFPLCVSPAGIQAIAHPEGELATSRACAARGVNMAISTFANYAVEEVRAAGVAVDPRVRHAMQSYTMRDRVLQRRMLERAHRAGCTAVLLTADSPVLGVRYNEWRHDFRTPAGLGFPNVEMGSEYVRTMSHEEGFTTMGDPDHEWGREVAWLRDAAPQMEIWVKGVLTAEDVREAVRWGVDGVLVSNHGGRQLDGVPATIDVLAECVEAAKGSAVRIHVDGGIRSGTDIFKCLALGAECCWVGRPALWGLAYNGQAGVELMLETLRLEFKKCMQLCGCVRVADITKACLGIERPDGPLARL